MRLRFIVGLILLGVSLQFIAKTLTGLLPMVKEAALYPVSGRILQRPFKRQRRTPERRVTMLQHLKMRFPKRKPVKIVDSADKTMSPSKDSGNAFMQIVLEDFRPPVNNTALGKDASERLEAFLVHKRNENAHLVNETDALFGKEAKKEIIYILIQDEQASLANASQSKTAQEYALRQEKTDRNTSQKLTKLFEKYKKQFNRRLYENSPEWNKFFKRVNDFQKAAD